MGFAEDHVYEYLRNNLNRLNCIDISEILDNLRGVLTVSTGEQLDRNLDRAGNRNTRFNFLNDLQKRDDWVNQFLKALWNCGNHELFYELQELYKSYRPSRVWEPDPAPYSLPHLPSNNYEIPPLEGPQRCASLPPEASNRFQEPQPGPPVARSLNQVQPEQESRWGHQRHERSDPSIQPRAPMSQNPPPAPVLPRPSSPPDQVDNMTSEDGISKRPVPESSTYPPPAHVVSQTETASPPEHSLPLASSLPTRMDIAMTQPLQEKSENREVARTAEQPISVVNTPRNNSVNEPPHMSVIQEVTGSDMPNLSSFLTSSMHEVYKAWISPQPRELPGPSQGTSNPPADQHFKANDTCNSQPMESAPNSETSSPSQHLSVLGLESGATAGLGHQHSEQSRRQQSVHRSTCRPTNVDFPLAIEKPGVLMSSAGFADIRGNTDEVQPLSREPILEISDDESSNERSQSSRSPQLPSTRDGDGRPIQQEVPTISTPKKRSLRSSPRKNPEENEEPRWVPSSVHGRPPNASSPQEAEENSFELSNDLSYYRFQYNEDPSVDLTDENSLPHQGTKNPSGIRNKSDRAASEDREKPGQSNLHNPVVIALSAVVVCLSIYIIWLKTKK